VEVAVLHRDKLGGCALPESSEPDQDERQHAGLKQPGNPYPNQ